MAIRKATKEGGLHAANKPRIDAQGHCTGTIKSVGYGRWPTSNKDKEAGERLEIVVSIDATKSPISSMICTGTSINTAYRLVGKKKDIKEYSRLVTLLYCLGLIDDDDLNAHDLDDARIAVIADALFGLENKRVSFQMTTLEKGFQVIDVTTIALLEDITND